MLFANGYHPRYRLVFAANRDEYYDRPAAWAHFGSDYPQVLAGRDLARMGAWLGVSRTGRFVTLTNYRDVSRAKPDARSRGELVSQYLCGTKPPRSYLEDVRETASLYPGFSLLAGNLEGIWYFPMLADSCRKLLPAFMA